MVQCATDRVIRLLPMGLIMHTKRHTQDTRIGLTRADRILR